MEEVSKVDFGVPNSPPSEECLLCKKKSENKLSAINEKKELLNAISLLKIEYEPIPSLTDYVCYQCVYRINLIIDYRRTIQRNIKKNRANYFYNRGDKEMCRKYLVDKTEKIPLVSPGYSKSDANNCSNLKISYVRSFRTSDTENSMHDFLFDCFNDVTQTEVISENETSQSDVVQTTTENPESSPKLLDIMFEKRESALATESGGNIHDYRGLLHSPHESFFKCNFCPRTYTREGFLKKHEKKHNAQNRTKNLRRSSLRHFQCADCNKTLESLGQLRAHKKTHRVTLKCSFCSAEFDVQIDLEFHEAICFGKKSAEEGSVHSRYLTRSHATTTHESDTDDDTLYSERMRNIDNWVQTLHPDKDDAESISTEASRSTRYSRTSTRTTFTIETESSDASVSSSVITRSRRVRRIRARDSVYGNRKRRRKSTDIPRNDIVYTCPELNCTHTETSLNKLMRHDMECHEQLLLHYCKRCRGRFIRQFYLDHHLKYQAPGRFVCCLCEQEFVYFSEIEHHFKLHKDSTAHKCEVCILSFITEHELQKHLCNPKHFENKRAKKSIFRAKYTYISFPNQLETSEEEGKTYKCELRILKLMDQERSNESEIVRWNPGIVFQTLPNGSHNCAVPLRCPSPDNLDT